MAAITDAAPVAQPAHPSPSILTTLLLLLAITVGCAAYLAVNGLAHSAEGYVGFFFAFYWLGLQRADLTLLPATVTGSVVGLALGWSLSLLMAQMGPMGGLVFIALVMVVLFALIRRHLRFAINDATMLMLTLATISHVQKAADFPRMFVTLAIAVVMFGGAAWIAARLQRRAAKA
jgi:hypothetical protein